MSRVSGRVWWSARVDLETAQAFEAKGNLEKAIEHYQYAARWWSPGTQTPIDARDALFRIGTECEANHRPELALRAYRRLRGVMLSTRWLLSGEDSKRPVIEERIASLMAHKQIARGGRRAVARMSPRSRPIIFNYFVTIPPQRPVFRLLCSSALSVGLHQLSGRFVGV